MYDQVYWMLTFGDTRHVDPMSLRPEMAPYTIFVDGISKAFAATGVRVGWVVGPPDVIDSMNDILGHVGAWAPRAEQVATASCSTRRRGGRVRDGAHGRRSAARSTRCTTASWRCAPTGSRSTRPPRWARST